MFTLLTFFLVVTTIITCLIDFDPMILLVMSLAVVSVSFALWIANKHKNMRAAGIVAGTVFDIILIPVLFGQFFNKK